MAVKTYDPAKVDVIVGIAIMGGFGPDVKVAISYDEDGWTKQIGVNGEGTRSKSNNRAATITLTLMQSSDSNQVLTTLYEADRATNAGVFPLTIRDASSKGTLHFAESAWIQKMPDSEYGIEAGTREWVIGTDLLITNLAGN